MVVQPVPRAVLQKSGHTLKRCVCFDRSYRQKRQHTQPTARVSLKFVRDMIQLPLLYRSPMKTTPKWTSTIPRPNILSLNKKHQQKRLQRASAVYTLLAQQSTFRCFHPRHNKTERKNRQHTSNQPPHRLPRYRASFVTHPRATNQNSKNKTHDIIEDATEHNFAQARLVCSKTTATQGESMLNRRTPQPTGHINLAALRTQEGASRSSRKVPA